MNKNVVLFILLLGMGLTACSTTSTAKPLEITIEMSEYAFAPETLEVQVGQEVILHLMNIGLVDHEIMFGREVATEHGVPAGFREDMFEAAGITPEVSLAAGSHEDDHEHNEEDEHHEDAHMDEGDEHAGDEHAHEHAGFMVLVPVGHDGYTMKFKVTEEMVGEWEIGCFEEGGIHYAEGMVGTLTVSP